MPVDSFNSVTGPPLGLVKPQIFPKGITVSGEKYLTNFAASAKRPAGLLDDKMHLWKPGNSVLTTPHPNKFLRSPRVLQKSKPGRGLRAERDPGQTSEQCHLPRGMSPLKNATPEQSKGTHIRPASQSTVKRPPWH